MSIKYDVVDCWECPLNGGGKWNPGHCKVSARGKGGDDYRYVPGPVCPLVLLDAANAENEILRQRNLSDPLIQATTKHLQAEIEQLHESLAAKERGCERLREEGRVIIRLAMGPCDESGREMYNAACQVFACALAEGGESYANPHTCPECDWQCSCSDQPCSCCDGTAALAEGGGE